jgi:hypothetical protein
MILPPVELAPFDQVTANIDMAVVAVVTGAVSACILLI